MEGKGGLEEYQKNTRERRNGREVRSYEWDRIMNGTRMKQEHIIKPWE